MKLRTAEDYPQKWGLITGFCSAPTDYIEMIRRDLELSVPLSVLSRLQNHYKIYEHRDPTVEELIMLDILATNAQCLAKEKRCFELAELNTNSEDIKAAFGDVLQKLRAVYPERKGPLSFEEILRTAGRYIDCIMPERYTRSIGISNIGKNDPAEAATASGSSDAIGYSAGNLTFAVGTPSEKVNIPKGDYVQVAKADGFTEIIKALRKDIPELMAKKVKNNIVEEILSDADHAEIYVPYSLPTAASFGKDDLLLLCKEKHTKELCNKISSFGLRYRLAGKKNKKGNLIFSGYNSPIKLHPSLIRSLTQIRRNELVKANISNELANGDPDCSFEMLTLHQWNTDSEPIVGHNGNRNDISITSVKSNITPSPYQSGIAQIICAAASAIAAGSSAENIKLTNVIRFPASSDPSILLAHLLGIYRAEIELCTSERESRLEISEGISKPESKTIAVSPKKALAKSETGSLWLVSPELEQENICFENIRRTFSYMTELEAKGLAARICALDANGIGSDDGVSFDVGASPKAKKKNIGAFLVLTNAELIGATGITTEKIGVIDISESPEEVLEV